MSDKKESKESYKDRTKNVRVRLYSRDYKSVAFSVKVQDGDTKMARQIIEKAFMRK